MFFKTQLCENLKKLDFFVLLLLSDNMFRFEKNGLELVSVDQYCLKHLRVIVRCVLITWMCDLPALLTLRKDTEQ